MYKNNFNFTFAFSVEVHMKHFPILYIYQLHTILCLR